jgi:hypothetical protein
MTWDPGDILDFDRRAATVYPSVDAVVGLEVRHRASGFGGKVVRFEAGGIVLRGPAGSERLFPMVAGAFAVDGKAVTLVRSKAVAVPRATASGSVAARRGRRAQVARSSRILVEGVHDAELVEKVWGDDLRDVGVVVERLDGMDVLPDVVRELDPAPGRRLGILLDHLVDGSKEARAAAEVRHPHVLVTGTPFVDVWAAVRPSAIGIDAWPDVPRGVPWKAGVLDALGIAAHPGEFWRQLLGSVRTYADLDPALVGAVERLIDFVTEEDA